MGEPILAATPVSPRPRRAPGHGAWGHAPLAGAQVRYLVVTPTRVVVFALDRDVEGPLLYRLLRIETEAPRATIRGVRLRTGWLSRSLTVLHANAAPWTLEVSRIARGDWGPVVDALGRLPADGEAPG